MKMTKRIFSLLLIAAITFVGCKPNDAKIQTLVSQAITAASDVSGATASVEKGVVTLSGEVTDDAAKTKAEALAKAVKGVKSVVNNLTVTPPAPAAPQVSALEQGVTDALKDFPSVNASVDNGVITLTGNISKSGLQKLMPALNSLNPTKVVNQLTIK